MTEAHAWNHQDITDLRRLVHEGQSTTDIARALGLTRGQVSGKIFRLNLCGLRIDNMHENLKASRGKSRKRKALKPHPVPRPVAKPMLSFSDVLEAVAKESGHDKRMLLGERRWRRLAYPRQLVMLIARQRCPWLSTVQIGRYLNRDHSTVCSGCRAAEARLKENGDYLRLYQAVNYRLDGMLEQEAA